MPGERTEQATQHRREKARKEGDMLHSRELSAAAGTLAGVMVLGAAGQPDCWWPGEERLPRFSLWVLRPAGSRPTIEPTLFAMRRLALGGSRAAGA